MASAHIQALLGPPSVDASHSKTLSYLNTRYKTFQDVEDADEFDDSVEEERLRNEKLKAELAQSQADADALIRETRSSVQSQLHTAQELSLLRHSLADELAYLSQELQSALGDPESKPTLLEDIETMHRSLKELQSVKGYVQIIQHALQLSEAAIAHGGTSSSPLESVSEYEKLQQFVSKVSQACAGVEDGAGQQKLHIITFLEGIRDKTWQDIKNVFTSSLLATSEKLQWPAVVQYTTVNPEDRRAFEKAFLDLLKLQRIGEKLHPLSQSRTEKDGLYPLQALVQPISLRFKYHFEGSRQTNRLDKPEWYFTHVLNVAHEHRSFIDSTIQSLLNSTEYRTFNAWREFTLLLLPLLSRKLRRTVPSLISHPPVLAHTIYQALSFDSALRDEGFGLEGTSAFLWKRGESTKGNRDEEKWQGISEVVLGRKEWFEAWMEGERKFAMDQYMEIISAPDAWLIADDEGEEEDGPVIDRELKPTNSARRVKALVEQVTDRYSPLPQFNQRTRFLIAVQLPLLESYHARISASLDAYETLSSSFMRAVPGALGSSVSEGSGRAGDTRRLTSGVEGVQRLCKALVSAKYVSVVMEAWGEELFFLELWAEINHKASLRSRAETVASLPDPTGTTSEVPEGTIFEELVVQYDKLVDRAEEMIIQSICGEVEAGLKAHFSGSGSSQPTPIPSTSHDEEIAISTSLLGPIALLSSHLTFLQQTLPQTNVISLYRKIASRLATHILQREITYRGRSRITPHLGKTIMAECELWAETCKLTLARGAGGATVRSPEAPWRSLLQAGRIVGSDGVAWQKIVDATLGMTSDQEWEKVMIDTVGFAELGREEVGQVLRTRVDFDH